MKSVLKIFGFLIFAEILTIFIDVTLAFSGHILLRMICAVCTAGILAGLSAQAGFSIAEDTRKKHIKPKKSEISGLTLTCTAPYLICWTALLSAKCGIIQPEFYRIYKLLCAPFLSTANLFSDDVSALSLPWSGVICLFLMSLLPGTAFCISYLMTYHQKTVSQIMYKK